MRHRYSFGPFEVLPRQRLVMAHGAPVSLGARAFDVLLALVENPDRLLTKNELLERVWVGVLVEEANLQVQVSALRRLLGADAIATIPGQGYRFTAVLDDEDDGAVASTTPPPLRQSLPSAAAEPALPQPRTRFIGREAALAACDQLLRGARLLTLTGLGGCGKTRLALALVRSLLDLQAPAGPAAPMVAFGAGHLGFADLAPARQPGDLVQAIAMALGLRAAAPLSMEGLIDHLGARPALIVLDNCEHLVEPVAALVDQLLVSCAGLKIVATSRERLRVNGEQLYRVPPMSLPVDLRLSSIEAAEAVRLFVDRAGLESPGFALDERNAPAIAEICQRLDGLPLAVELAAARTKLLPVREIAARLDDRFRFLVGGSRNLPRHASLEATLAQSYEALSAPAQALLHRLSVFTHGCSLAGAAFIAAAVDSSVADSAGGAALADDHATLELLTELHDGSMLLVDPSEATGVRYHLSETVRHYARERLAAEGEAGAVQGRFRAWTHAVQQQAADSSAQHPVRLERSAPVGRGEIAQIRAQPAAEASGLDRRDAAALVRRGDQHRRLAGEGREARQIRLVRC